MNRRQFLASIAAVVPALPFLKAKAIEPVPAPVALTYDDLPRLMTGAMYSPVVTESIEGTNACVHTVDLPDYIVVVDDWWDVQIAMVGQAASEYGAVWFSEKLDG